MQAQLGNPTLMWLEEGHVLGAIVVHEIGHLLGEDHTRTGIMRPILRSVEWELLLRQRLAFSPGQARALRAAIGSVLDVQLAERR